MFQFVRYVFGSYIIYMIILIHFFGSPLDSLKPAILLDLGNGLIWELGSRRDHVGLIGLGPGW